MEVILSRDNFENEVLKSDRPVLVDFWAPWCGPCHVIAPVVTDLANKYPEKLKVGKLNVDENPEIANQYFVHSIPALKLFKGGKVADEIVGVVPGKQLAQMVEKHL